MAIEQRRFHDHLLFRPAALAIGPGQDREVIVARPVCDQRIEPGKLRHGRFARPPDPGLLEPLLHEFLRFRRFCPGHFQGFFHELNRCPGVIISDLGAIHAHGDHLEMRVMGAGYGDRLLKRRGSHVRIADDGQDGFVCHGALLLWLQMQ